MACRDRELLKIDGIDGRLDRVLTDSDGGGRRWGLCIECRATNSDLLSFNLRPFKSIHHRISVIQASSFASVAQM